MIYPKPNGLPRVHRWAGTSAVAGTLLFSAANALWWFAQPGQGASGPQLLRFYSHLAGRVVAGSLLSLISMALLVVFGSAFRGVLVELEADELHANLAFGGVIVGMAAGVGAETINMAAALRAGHGELTKPLAQALFDTSYVLGYNGAGLGLGLLNIATGAAALRSRALLPRWLATVAIALGVVMLTPVSRYTLGPSFLLLLILGLLLLRGYGLPVPEATGARRAAHGI